MRLATVTLISAGCLVAAVVLVNGGHFPRTSAGWIASGALVVAVNLLTALWERGSRWLVRERRPAPLVPPDRR